MERRKLLKYIAGSIGVSYLSPVSLLATPQHSPRMLLVFLRGAYDSNHLLIPYKSDDYYDARPHIALSASSNNPIMPLDSEWAIAPSVQTTLLPLWEQKQIAFIPFSGSHDLSRSHFHTQDTIEAGRPPSAEKSHSASGFMARLAKHLTGTQSIAFSSTLPKAFYGHSTPNISLRNHKNSQHMGLNIELLSEMYPYNPHKANIEEIIALRSEIAHSLTQETKSSGIKQAGPTGFEQEASQIASLMRTRYRLGMVNVGGWDTHADQGGMHGNLALRLKRLSQGLKNYADTLGVQEWRNTVVIVISEFGRTFKENGSRGTDHGHGTAYWILGGSINGGRIIGEQTDVGYSSLLQGRDYPVLNDYRATLGGIIQGVWGLKNSIIQNDIFPGSTPKAFGLT